VNRRWGHDQAAIATHVDSREQPDDIRNRHSRVREVEMPPAAARDGLKRIGQPAVFHDQRVEGILAAVPDIDVQHEDAGARASRNRDVGTLVMPPELLDGDEIRSCALLPVPKSGMLSGCRARPLAILVAPLLAGAESIQDRMRREHAQPALSARDGASQTVRLLGR
jgi:hypothetical protein